MNECLLLSHIPTEGHGKEWENSSKKDRTKYYEQKLMKWKTEIPVGELTKLFLWQDCLCIYIRMGALSIST